MNKLIVITVMCMSLAACFYQSVNETELEVARLACKDSKVTRIDSNSIGGVIIYCFNGIKFHYTNGTVSPTK